MDGCVLDLQKLSTEDGPGIRTTVFLKGCNLNCSWCHNPESISSKARSVWIKTHCISCGFCVAICPNNALTFNNGIIKDKSKCINCFKCTENCPTEAMERKGTMYSEDELAAELLKDKAYYDRSGGGITVSGGEPLLQAEFVQEIFKCMQANEVHTALDTAGNVNFDIMSSVLEYSNLLLLDIKTIDCELHKKFTGTGNAQIIKNAVLSASFARKNGLKIWIRTPVIPDATDSKENILAIGKFIAENMVDVVMRWELCAFNNLCKDKYERLGMTWEFKDKPLMRREQMDYLQKIAEKSVGKIGLAVWTGTVQIQTLN